MASQFQCNQPHVNSSWSFNQTGLQLDTVIYFFLALSLFLSITSTLWTKRVLRWLILLADNLTRGRNWPKGCISEDTAPVDSSLGSGIGHNQLRDDRPQSWHTCTETLKSKLVTFTNSHLSSVTWAIYSQCKVRPIPITCTHSITQALKSQPYFNHICT